MNAHALAKPKSSLPSVQPGRITKYGLEGVFDETVLSTRPGIVPNADPAAPISPELATIRFLNSFRVLLRSVRLYQKNHPRVHVNLEAADRHLRAVLAVRPCLAVGVERDRLVVPTLREHPLPDPHGEFSNLAEELSRSGITSLVFLPETNLGELDMLAHLLHDSSRRAVALSSRSTGAAINVDGRRDVPFVSASPTFEPASYNATPAAPNPQDSHALQAGRADQSWAKWVAEYHISGIRVNAPLERQLDTALASLVAALLAYGSTPEAEPGKPPAPAPLAANLDELRAALLLLAEVTRSLDQARHSPPQEAARAIHGTLAEADRRSVRLLVAATSLHAPREGEPPAAYLARLADTLALEFVGQEFRAGRITPPELPALFVRLCALSPAGPETRNDALDAARPVFSDRVPAAGDHSPFARWAEEARAERLHERFWANLPAPEKSAVLRSRDAWCVPINAIGRYLQQLAETAPKTSVGPSHEGRQVLMNYANCLESDQSHARLAVASGLVELRALLEWLWPHQLPEELSRGVLRALEREVSPGIAGLLAAATENLARLMLDKADYAGFESVLEALEHAPRDAEHAHLAALAARLVADERWFGLVDAALYHWPRIEPSQGLHRPLDPVLPRLLRRDPQRLVDRLGLLLTAPSGYDAVLAMARLLRAVGELAIRALETRLFDSGRQRVATAIKLLAAAQPDRLAAALSHALPRWDWRLQDLAVSELARPLQQNLASGAARTFLAMLDEAHPMVVPMMLDQIGLAQETEAVPLLVEIAAGEHKRLRDIFIRIKAVEALGRMRAIEAADTLQAILDRRNGLLHAEPAALRAAAEEALALIENRPSSARVRAAYDALEKANLSFMRPRLYLRVPLPSPLTAQIQGPVLSLSEGLPAMPARVRTISLGGAFLESKRRLNVGEALRFAIRSGLRHIHGTAVVRNVAPNGGGVEFVHIDPEDRERLRRLVRRLHRT